LKPFRQGSPLTTVFQVELLLILSMAAALLVCGLLSSDAPGEEQGDNRRRSLLRNYRILKGFLADPPASTHQPKIIRDMEALESARRLLDEKRYQEIPQILRSLDSEYRYIQLEKRKIYLEYLYGQKKYHTFLQDYKQDPLPDPGWQRMYIHSLVRTRKNRRAFLLFKELFPSQHLRHFQNILSPQQLRLFLEKLSFEEWLNKFLYLTARGQFSELFREQKYSPFKQLNDLFNGEYNYRRRRYSRAQYWLNRVSAPELENHKKKILIKIKIRQDDYEGILGQIDALKHDTAVYPQLLLDSGGLMTVKGEYDLALELFSRYIALSRTEDDSHWRVLWISAWAHYRQHRRGRALQYFKQGTASPIPAYRRASQYWWSRIKNTPSPDLRQTPFSYYFTRSMPTDSAPPRLLLDSRFLRPFTQLIEGRQSPLFREIVRDLTSLLQAGFSQEALSFIRGVQAELQLTQGDQNMLKIIESILYLKQGKLQQAFITFRKHFPHYPEIVLPRFLRALYLPLKYESLVRQHARKNRIDPHLILALIREESYFRPDAVSRARALGLMQLLLGTARRLARPDNMRLNRQDLFKPELNVRLGCQYLKQLLDRYNGKVYLALAAYNAGEHRVDRWLREFGPVPDDQFIEMIPFTETRAYVKTILRNHFYYRHYYPQ
jgi:hypothetical protein